MREFYNTGKVPTRACICTCSRLLVDWSRAQLEFRKYLRVHVGLNRDGLDAKLLHFLPQAVHEEAGCAFGHAVAHGEWHGVVTWETRTNRSLRLNVGLHCNSMSTTQAVGPRANMLANSHADEQISHTAAVMAITCQ